MATDQAVTGPPIAIYAIGCAAFESTKGLFNRVRCLSCGVEELAHLRHQADLQFLQTYSYAAASLLILNDYIYRLWTGDSANVGAIALGFTGAADS